MQKIIAETGDFPLAPAIYPNLKDAEKVLANAIFMENPSDEQFKKLKDDSARSFWSNDDLRSLARSVCGI